MSTDPTRLCASKGIRRWMPLVEIAETRTLLASRTGTDAVTTRTNSLTPPPAGLEICTLARTRGGSDFCWPGAAPFLPLLPEPPDVVGVVVVVDVVVVVAGVVVVLDGVVVVV